MTTTWSPTCTVEQRSLRPARGFTLIELLVVLVILSSMALATVSLTSNADDQIRLEDTQRRLTSIRHAVLGDPRLVSDGQKLVAGFVADLGRLPASMDELALGRDGADQLPVLALRVPQMGLAVVDCLGFPPSAGAAVLEPVPELAVLRGWRAGYLTRVPGRELFGDGWANAVPAGDSADHGWVLQPEQASSPGCEQVDVALSVTSLGADGALGVSPDGTAYDEDLSLSLERAAWRVDLRALSVRVTNATGESLNQVRAVVLAWVEGRGWKQVASDGHALDAAGAEGPSEIVFAFAPAASDGLRYEVPAGAHPVVLVSSPAAGPGELGNATVVRDGAGRPIGRRVTFHAAAAAPTLSFRVE